MPIVFFTYSDQLGFLRMSECVWDRLGGNVKRRRSGREGGAGRAANLDDERTLGVVGVE